MDTQNQLLQQLLEEAANADKTIFQVSQFRNGGVIRNVKVPTEKLKDLEKHLILELVFHYGQNDFQPQDHPSVSVGDIILYNEERWMVAGFGFKQITSEEWQQLCQASIMSKAKNVPYYKELYDIMGEKSFQFC